MPPASPCLAVSIFNTICVTSETIPFTQLQSWTIGAQFCTVLCTLNGLAAGLSSGCFSFSLCSLTCLTFWKGCNLLDINLYVAPLYVLAPQVMGGDVHR